VPTLAQPATRRAFESEKHRSWAPTPTTAGFAPRPHSQHSPVPLPYPHHPGKQSATASTARATANSTERYTQSCSPACATTPAHAPTPPAAKPKAAAPEKSDAASSATPPDTSTASSKPQPKTPQITKLDRHRSIAPANAVRELSSEMASVRPVHDHADAREADDDARQVVVVRLKAIECDAPQQ
jgi:hypothetical protein